LQATANGLTEITPPRVGTAKPADFDRKPAQKIREKLADEIV